MSATNTQNSLYPQLPARLPTPSAPPLEGSNEEQRSKVVAVAQPKFEEIVFATNYEAQAVALIAPGFCFAAGGLVGSVIFANTLLIPSLAVAILGLVLLIIGGRMHCYNNLATWNYFRQALQNPQVTFEQMVDEHGLKRLCRYQLVPLETLQRKYREWLQSPISDEKRQKYSLFDLCLYQIISPQEFDQLDRIKLKLDAALQSGIEDNILKYRKEYRDAAGYPCEKENQQAFKKQMQNLRFEDMYAEYNFFQLAYEGRISREDFQKLASLRARRQNLSTVSTDRDFLNIELIFNRDFKRPNAEVTQQ